MCKVMYAWEDLGHSACIDYLYSIMNISYALCTVYNDIL